MIATTETRTVYVRGEAVQFQNQFDSVQAAVNVLKNSQKRSNFASDLIVAFNRDRISPKQIDWLLYLANEAVAPKKEINGEYLDLVNQLYSAKGNGKRFMLRLPDSVTLSTVIQGNNAGAIYVKVGGEYAGKIKGSISGATRGCTAWNNGSAHLSKNVDPKSGKCRFLHKCDQFVYDKGVYGQCLGDHMRKECDYDVAHKVKVPVKA